MERSKYGRELHHYYPEALYFGNSLDHTLVNPNQIRAFGINVYNNSYERDYDRSMGIQLNDHKRLPFRSDGSTIYFTTWFPMDDEMEMYEHVVITSDQPWDPHNLVMPGGDNDDRVMGDYACAIQQIMSNERHHE